MTRKRALMTFYALRAAALVAMPVYVLTSGCDADPESSYRITKPTDPLPALTEISSISAEMEGAYDDPVPEFDVPRNEWAAVRSALLPCEIDPEPTTYAVLGKLEMRLNSRASKMIWLYWVDDVGAFSIGGEYYRGGDSQELVGILRRAYYASSQGVQSREPGPN